MKSSLSSFYLKYKHGSGCILTICNNNLGYGDEEKNWNLKHSPSIPLRLDYCLRDRQASTSCKPFAPLSHLKKKKSLLC